MKRGLLKTIAMIATLGAYGRRSEPERPVSLPKQHPDAPTGPGPMPDHLWGGPQLRVNTGSGRGLPPRQAYQRVNMKKRWKQARQVR